MNEQVPVKKLVCELISWANHIHSARSEEKALLIRAAREIERLQRERDALYRANVDLATRLAHEPSADDLKKATKFDHETWPHGMLWQIGGVKFVEWDDAIAAIRKAQS